MASGAHHTVWTIGHSNHSFEHFCSMLESAGVCALADVRRFPGSRRQPQFASAALAAALESEGIAYRHFPELGGRRSSKEDDSPNKGWRVAAFRAYADYMLTGEFDAALIELLDFAARQPTAIMCAEAVPWRCHRRLIADAFVVRGWTVLDIFSPTKVEPHVLTPFARTDGVRLTYPEAPTAD